MMFSDWVNTVPSHITDEMPGPDGVRHSIPLVTVLLNRDCEGSTARFHRLIDLMRLAYEAGCKNSISASHE